MKIDALGHFYAIVVCLVFVIVVFIPDFCRKGSYVPSTAPLFSVDGEEVE